MPKYVSFLRGVNVGGHKVIKMEELKKIFESMKLKNVSTFIASGNILFESPEKDENKVNKKIEAGLQKALGYEVESFIRSGPDMLKIVESNPFTGFEISKEVKIYLSFFSNEPGYEVSKTVGSFSYDAEKFRIINKELYVLLERKKLKDKAIFSTNFIEKKIKLKCTTRDWNTIIKITNLITA